MTREFRQNLPPAVHAPPMVDPLHGRAVRGLVIGLVAALVLAMVGALGTDKAPFGPRMVYWLSVVLPGSLLGLLMDFAVDSWGRLRKHPWLKMLLVSVMVAVPHTFIVAVATALMFGFQTITPSALIWFGLVVLFVSMVLTAINLTTAPAASPLPLQEPLTPPVPAEPAMPAAVTADPPTLPAALIERLPPRLQSGRLLALEAEDHYLRVHTDLGSDLVLMRMVDAIALLADVPGARVHRSWWVARAAVVDTVRDGERLLLKLTGGLAAPVSRTARRELGEAGWF
jgi:DNA-binding LytR/AlgR family response regulator